MRRRDDPVTIVCCRQERKRHSLLWYIFLVRDERLYEKSCGRERVLNLTNGATMVVVARVSSRWEREPRNDVRQMGVEVVEIVMSKWR
jgi:hypothetical protein